MAFYKLIFKAWKVMEFECGSWKVTENDRNEFFENKQARNTLNE